MNMIDDLSRNGWDTVAPLIQAKQDQLIELRRIAEAKAASIIDKMESDGLVGEANHVGKREVIIKQPPQGGY